MTFIQKLTPEAFQVVEVEIRNNHKRPEDIQETWKKLHNDFKSGEPLTDQAFWWTYFRLYTELTWKLHATLSREEFVHIAIGRQISMALLLDFDVWKTIMWYLASRGLDDKDMSTLYADIRQAFFESEALAGMQNNKPVTIKELLLEVKKMKRAGISSLEIAEIMSNVKNTFFPKDSKAALYAHADAVTVTEQFIGLCDFFTVYEPEKIWFLVQAYVKPELYVSLEKKIQDAEKKLESTLEVGNSKSEDAAQSEEVKKTSAAQIKVSHADLQKTIEKKFKKDINGQFVDVAGVLAMLNDFADRYGDDHIRELYVFNEKTGMFEWNTEPVTT